MTSSETLSNAPISRSIGFWLVLAMGLLQAWYALQAFIDPAAFAIYRGSALADSADAEWVRIYASRTLFVALVVGFLLARKDLASLKWVALFGLVMPLSDALLAREAGAPFAVVARHLATMVYLLVTAGVLHLWTRRNPPVS